MPDERSVKDVSDKTKLVFGVPLGLVFVLGFIIPEMLPYLVVFVAVLFSWEALDAFQRIRRLGKPLWPFWRFVLCAYAALGCALDLTTREGGLALLLIIMVSNVGNDVTANFGGKRYKKKWFGDQIYSEYSPKKTWEGFICGYAAGMIVFAAGFIVDAQFSGSILPDWAAGVLVLAVPALAPKGDLWASRVKRQTKVEKDLRSLIPGHGMWDRIDSMCLAIVFCWVLGKLFFF